VAADKDLPLLFRTAAVRSDMLPPYDKRGLLYSRTGPAPVADRIARIVLDTDDQPISPGDDITLVAGHFARTLGADGWALTSSPRQGMPSCHAAAGLGETFAAPLLRIADRIDSAPGHSLPAPVWCERLAPPHAAAALVIPVQHMPGHASTFVNLIFADVDESRRAAIERACLREWPSVSAYLRLWQSTRLERRVAEGVSAGLNLVAIGIVLLSGDGQIVFANDAARVLMDRQDGIREHRGQVQATHRSDAAAFSTAVGHVLAHYGTAAALEPTSLLMLHRDLGPPLVTSFVCAPRSVETPEEGGALLFFVDPGLDIHQLAEPVCKLFRLSRVETELACLLASGQTLAAAAQSLHVKVSTARGYLKQVFVKTGSNRQVDLVRLIFSNLIRTAHRDHARRR
jgi:DNA-binding CsgD family transcriptional regulator